MIAIKINDIKNFMGKLLLKESFDSFFLEKAQVLTRSMLTLSGRRNQNWYDSDQWDGMEQELSGDCSFLLWKEVKNTIFTYIRGDHPPDTMKISFKAGQRQTGEWLEDPSVQEACRKLGAELFLQLRYEQGELQLTTGIAFEQFQMERTVERAWDEAVLQFLRRERIGFEEA